MMGPKHILLTGATSGIGLATALCLGKAGHHVIAAGRSVEKLKKLKETAAAGGIALSTCVLDVTNEMQIAEAHHYALQVTHNYGIDILINNAGYAQAGAIEELPVAQLKQQFDTNVVGLMAVTQAFLPEMRDRRSGRIINISSVLGISTLPLLGAYCASKHAVEALTEALRMELLGTGIDVISIAPGAVRTEFNSTALNLASGIASRSAHYQSEYQAFMTYRRKERGVKPDVVAKTILRAVSSRRPKPRVVVPFPSNFIAVAKLMLPVRFLDNLITKKTIQFSKRTGGKV